MLTEPQYHQNSLSQELYLTAINGTVANKLAIANDPNITTPIAKILRHDKSRDVRKAIINNSSVPSFFYRGVNPSNVADILVDMVDAAYNHIQAAGLSIPTQGEIVREHDADSDVAIIELKSRVAVTTGELTMQNIRDGLPITYDVWTLPASDNEPMTFNLETENLQEAIGVAIKKSQRV